jgi:hypothetical protein
MSTLANLGTPRTGKNGSSERIAKNIQWPSSMVLKSLALLYLDELWVLIGKIS